MQLKIHDSQAAAGHTTTTPHHQGTPFTLWPRGGMMLREEGS